MAPSTAGARSCQRAVVSWAPGGGGGAGIEVRGRCQIKVVPRGGDLRSGRLAGTMGDEGNVMRLLLEMMTYLEGKQTSSSLFGYRVRVMGSDDRPCWASVIGIESRKLLHSHSFSSLTPSHPS